MTTADFLEKVLGVIGARELPEKAEAVISFLKKEGSQVLSVREEEQNGYETYTSSWDGCTLETEVQGLTVTYTSSRHLDHDS